jgi:hypothetical protein
MNIENSSSVRDNKNIKFKRKVRYRYYKENGTILIFFSAFKKNVFLQ